MLNFVRQRPILSFSAILALLLFSLFSPTGSVRVVVAVLLAASAVLIGCSLRKHPSHSVNRRQVFMLLAACAALFQMLRFLSGIYFGFYVNYPTLSLPSFFLFILPYAVTIVASEFLRSAFLGQRNRVLAVLSYFVCLFGELAMAGGFSALGDRYQFLNVFAQTLLPAILANLVYHYMSRRYGMLPNIVYRLILFVLPMFLPYAPAIPEALEVLLSLLCPALSWAFMDLLFEKKQKKATGQTSRWTYLGFGVSAACAIAVILLITGQFRYGVLVIATPSMQGTLDVGDAILYEEYDGEGVISEEEIILFSKNGTTTVVHRVVDIEHINGQYRYYTKGDTNKDPDYGYVTADQITGRVCFRIPYLGSAALWFRSLFT